jgi:hypothetical protein
MSYEEEDTRRRQDALIHSCPPFDSVPRPPFMNPPAHSRMGRKGCGTGRVGGPGPKGLRTQTGGHRDTLLGVTDGVSGRKNGLVKGIFHALYDKNTCSIFRKYLQHAKHLKMQKLATCKKFST